MRRLSFDYLKYILRWKSFRWELQVYEIYEKHEARRKKRIDGRIASRHSPTSFLAGKLTTLRTLRGACEKLLRCLNSKYRDIPSVYPLVKKKKYPFLYLCFILPIVSPKRAFPFTSLLAHAFHPWIDHLPFVRRIFLLLLSHPPST